MTYRSRVADRLLLEALEAAGAVLVEGPRACGKTATARQAAASEVLLDSDDGALAMAEALPALLLDGASPRLIDEWQLAPRLWNQVRHAVDETVEPGRFILTGSATPADDVTRHSGAGRIIRFRMRPMTLLESGASSGEVSLAHLLDGGTVQGSVTSVSVPDLAEIVVRGGWPALQSLAAAQAQRTLRSYLDDIARVDISSADPRASRRDASRVRRMLASYARHVATSASMATIARDTVAVGEPAIKDDTVAEYIAALERIWVIEEQPSWGPHLRSRDVVRKAPVRHFVDPSLAAAAMGASPDRLLQDLESFGLLFESLAVRDLRVYAQLLDGEILHYRDARGTEADAVIQLRDGRWALVEVKLAASRVGDAAASLRTLEDKIDTSRSGGPAARIIITGGEYAYTRDDGVHVVPLACLGP
ncbi:ATP-binding protein [Demequina soli]|uniref:ATP-binding protein n=1 Tax=Demequina soli TaxID=1638987 RepID=UPI00078449A9|nr:DUF4143 domain-containing protein [Demequina soli]